MFFTTKNSSKSRREKSQEKIQAEKKAGPEAPEISYKKQYKIQNNNGSAYGAPTKRGGAFGAAHFLGCCYDYEAAWFPGCPWLTMVYHGYPWTTVAIHA